MENVRQLANIHCKQACKYASNISQKNHRYKFSKAISSTKYYIAILLPLCTLLQDLICLEQSFVDVTFVQKVIKCHIFLSYFKFTSEICNKRCLRCNFFLTQGTPLLTKLEFVSQSSKTWLSVCGAGLLGWRQRRTSYLSWTHIYFQSALC